MSGALQWSLDPSLSGGVGAWVVEVDGLQVVDDGHAHAALTRLGESLEQRWRGTLIGDIEGIEVARRLYRRYGVDPTRTRPSSEALLRRAMKRQGFYRIDNVVDTGNWVSLEFLVPLGLYDRAFIEGTQVRVRVGNEDESYEGIRKGPVNVGGRLCVSDARGAFGSPTSDSDRARIRATTRDVAAILFAPREASDEQDAPMHALLRTAGTALAERLVACGGTLRVSAPLRP